MALLEEIYVRLLNNIIREIILTDINIIKYYTMDILEKINKIPEEVALYIKTFISKDVLFLTNKSDYDNNIMKIRFLYHNTNINKRFLYNTETAYYSKLDSYINFLIKNDFDYVFEKLIYYKHNHWVTIKRYTYKGVSYSNYLTFLNQLCIARESTKCRNVIKRIEKSNPLLRKKRHKTELGTVFFFK